MTRPARRAATLAMLTAVFTAMLFPSVGGAQLPTSPEAFLGMPGGALGSIADVSAGPATVRGRVIREGESTGVGDIPVILYALTPNGVPGLRGLVTDEDGAFAFESIANDPATVYLLGASYAEIPFGMRFSFEPGELERQIDLPVADATSDASGVEVGEVQIELEEGCANLSVRESHRLDNPGTRTVYIPEADRDGGEPILRVMLPAGATGLQSGLGEDLITDGDTLSFWGPLRPGQRELEFSYDLPGLGAAFEMSRSFPSGARRLILVGRPGGPKLTRSGPEDAEVQPGDSIALHVERAETDDSDDRISAVEARIWLELDDAAITVEQQYTLAVEGDEPLHSKSGAPLFCIALPDGADELRFSSKTLERALSRDPSGALALRGPLPAGETEIALRFLLPIERSDPLFSQVMPLDVSLLSVLIADTGLAADTSRLHQKRPVRTPDRSYLHLEGFGIPAGESVELRLRPLEARKSLPMPAATGVALATAAIAIGFLTAPLRQAGAEPDMPPSAASRAADQRESVLAAIRGLDEDFEIGKMSEPDYREIRLALRAEAVDLLRVERATLAEVAETDVTPRSCPRCAAAMGTDARFCSQCGTPLDESGSADEVPPV